GMGQFLENRYRTHLISMLGKSQKPGFYLYFSSPNQKLIETRFLAPCVNLKNQFLSIFLPTQKLKDVKWVLEVK
ncbi:hypothetical protein, partial [Tychonema sp. LEGE 07203]|uniref:hypothetical protein n=1 Tax=Tychonema sp. LEGE 07203 TaxID=1828671 RepID=UPI001D14B109